METGQETLNQPKQKEEQKNCLDPPGTIDIPDDPPCPEYNDIPTKNGIDLKLKNISVPTLIE